MSRYSITAEILLARAIAAETSGNLKGAELLFIAACNRESADLGVWRD